MARPEHNDYKGFGTFLRDLRKKRAVTLKDVAAASNEISRDPNGVISHPYLSQLESGRRLAVSLSKLFTLAAIYQVKVEEMIDRVPSDRRESLSKSLARWRQARFPEPIPISRLPWEIREDERFLDDALASIALNVQLPLADERAARELIRKVIIHALAPPYLLTVKPERFSECWKLFYEFEDDWWLLSHSVLSELEHSKDDVLSLVGLASNWTVRFGTKPKDGKELFSCHFKTKEDERAFGFDDIPAALIEGLRWRQIAGILYASRDENFKSIYAPPVMADAFLDFILWTIHPDETLEPFIDDITISSSCAPHSTADLLATINAAAKKISSLQSGKIFLDQTLLDNIAGFISSGHQSPGNTSRRLDRRQTKIRLGSKDR